MAGLNVQRGIGGTRRLDGTCPVDQAAFLVYADPEENESPTEDLKDLSKKDNALCKQCGSSEGIEIEIETIVSKLFNIEENGIYREDVHFPRYYKETVTYFCSNCNSVIPDKDITSKVRFLSDKDQTHEEK